MELSASSPYQSKTQETPHLDGELLHVPEVGTIHGRPAHHLRRVCGQREETRRHVLTQVMPETQWTRLLLGKLR